MWRTMSACSARCLGLFAPGITASRLCSGTRSLSTFDPHRKSNTQIKRKTYLRKARGSAVPVPRDERLADPTYGTYAGDHIFGVQPVHAALRARKRKISELLVQEGMDPKNKKDAGVAQAILDLAAADGVPVRYFPKHDLNMLCDNHLHQGFLLRASPIAVDKVQALAPADSFKCVLVLDEVVDPQNLGALLRSAYFMKCDRVIVCTKNSAPLSPVVSKTSAGALELMDLSCVHNLMNFLDNSRDNGWKVIGSALSEDAIPLNQLEVVLDVPHIIVLGNEGRGVRKNILNRCDILVKLEAQQLMTPGHTDDVALLGNTSSSSNNNSSSFSCGVVDSLNVSVAAGILLYHFLGARG